MCGDEVREILAVGNHPDREDIGLTTRRPLEDSTTLELETERAGLAWYRFTRASDLKQGVAKHFPSVGGKAQRNEEHGLEPPHGMGGRQQVVTNFSVVDDSKVTIRQTHDAFSTPKLREPAQSLARVRPTYRRSAAAARETWWHQVAMSEPVVLHHGSRSDGSGCADARPAAATAVRWAALVTGRARRTLALFFGSTRVRA